MLEAEAGPWAYNPIGIVHGGWYAAVLDAHVRRSGVAALRDLEDERSTREPRSETDGDTSEDPG